MSSRSMGHSGLGTNSTRMRFSCHHTSYLGFWHQYICFLTCYIFASRSSRFLFHFKTRRRSTEAARRQPIDYSALFAPPRSRHTFFYSAPSVIASPVPVQFRGRIHPVPCGPVFSYLSSTQAFLMSYLSLTGRPCSSTCGPRGSPRWHSCRANRRNLWPPFLTPLYPAQQQLYMVCIPHPLSMFVP